MTDCFITALATILASKGVSNARQEAETYVRDNPGMEIEMTPEGAAREWIDAATEAEDWRDPARYGAS